MINRKEILVDQVSTLTSYKCPLCGQNQNTPYLVIYKINMFSIRLCSNGINSSAMMEELLGDARLPE